LGTDWKVDKKMKPSKIENQIVAFRVPKSLNAKLDKYADMEMLSKSDIIRRAVLKELKVLQETHGDLSLSQVSGKPNQWSVK